MRLLNLNLNEKLVAVCPGDELDFVKKDQTNGYIPAFDVFFKPSS